MDERLLAAAAGVLAAAFAAPEAPRALLHRRLQAASGGRRLGKRRLLVVATAVTGVAALASLADRPHLLLLACVGLGLVVAIARLVREGRRRSARSLRRAQVIELCDALVAELRAGQPGAAALREALTDWPDLQPVAAAAALGGDVPTVLRNQALPPGAEPLAHIAAGWEVALRSGAGLADVLDRLSMSLRSDEEVRLEVAGTLGPPRATARLLAVLPVFGATLGMSLGADPLRVLLGSMLGACLLAAGTALAVTGLFWVERIAAAAEG